MTRHPPPSPAGPGPYGLQRIKAGVYLHRSGRYVLRTSEWEGPRGGTFSLWEGAEWDNGFVIDGLGGRYTLRDKAAELDKEATA